MSNDCGVFVLIIVRRILRGPTRLKAVSLDARPTKEDLLVLYAAMVGGKYC